MKISKSLILGMFVASLVVMAATPASAAEYELIALGDTATVNGAIFEAYNPNTSSGTGNYDSFLRVQKDGIERGYNTDAKKVEFETKSGKWTHSLPLSWVPIIANPLDATGLYREFKSDLNQTASAEGPRITLDELEIYLTHTPDIFGYPFPSGSLAGQATLVWSMDDGGDNVIKMNADVSAGSGKPDITLFVPNDVFNVAGFDNCNYNPLDTACDTYVVFYTQYGGQTHSGILYPASDGFEEWGRNIYTPASKSGVKFNDLNHNGARDSGEPGLGGWTIYVDYDDSGTLDIGEPFAVTASDGTYTIAGITPGTYKVREVGQVGWTQSYPAIGYHEETFDWAMVLTGNDFGNWQPQPDISITKSADVLYFCLSDAPVPVTYTYLVENTGDEDLENVAVTDDKCGPVSGPTGDSGDGYLNPGEIWTYTCSTSLSATTTNTADVVGYGVLTGGEVTDSDSVTVDAYDVDVTVDPAEATICEGGAVPLCAVASLGSGDYSYLWSTGETTACILADATGQYCVTVHDNVTGCEDTACADVTVVPVPVCSITGLTAICEDDAGVPYCSEFSADSYNWSIKGDAVIDGSTTSQCVSVTPIGVGSFTLILDVCNGPVELDCCSQCDYTVTVNPCIPGIDVEKYTDIDSFCLSEAPYPVTYTYLVSATGDEPLESVSLEDLDCTPVRQPDAPGDGDDILELGEVWVYTCSTYLSGTKTNTVDAEGYGYFSGDRVTDSDTATVTAYDLHVEVTPPVAEICAGDDPVPLCANVTLGLGDYSYLWSTGETTQCIYVDVQGEYCVDVLDNDTGCTARACATLTVIQAPDCSINSGPRSLCDEDIGTPIEYCSGAAADGYQWVIVSGPATIDGPDHEQCVDIIPTGLGTIVLELQIWNDVAPDGACGNSCQIEILVEECSGGAYCTFTQGFWGNEGGVGCDPGVTTVDLLTVLLGWDPLNPELPGTNPVVVGIEGERSITFDYPACVLLRLPAGGTPKALPPGLGDAFCDNLPSSLVKKNTPEINNVLVGQAVALTLNLRLYPGCLVDGADLRIYTLTAGPLCTVPYGSDAPCPEKVVIPASVEGLTVEQLLEEANKALAGQATTASVSDINKAVDAINRAFDECREIVSCPTEEICDNGCDDDFDGLIDLDDPDCILIPVSQ